MAGRILMDRNQSNHNPPTSGSSSDDLCFSVNDKIWQKFCSILQEAYPNWMPLPQLLYTYEQLYQEALSIPPWTWTTLCCANLIRNTDGYEEIRWNQDDCQDRSTSSTVSISTKTYTMLTATPSSR